jgi:DNA primase
MAEIERMNTTRPEHEAVRAALLQTGGANSDELASICGADALEKLTHARHVQIAPGVRSGAGQDIAEMSVAEELAKLAARRGALRELDDALEDFSGAADEVLTTRLRQANEARNNSEKSGSDDRAEYDLGPNGARVKRDEKQKLSSLLDQIDFSKGRRDRP